MNVLSEYRTVVLRVDPNPFQLRLLRQTEKSVYKFLDYGRLKLQSELYHAFNAEIPTRSLALLSKRFTGSMGEKALIPFDGDNSRFVEDRGLWFIQVQLGKRGDKRERLPLWKTQNKYYDEIRDMSEYPFFLARENDKWFTYVSVPLPPPTRSNRVVGVDFNLEHWVASEAEGRPLMWGAKPYSRQVDQLIREIGRAQQEDVEDSARKEKLDKLYSAIEGVRRKSHSLFLQAMAERYGKATLAVENVEVIYRLRAKENRKTNNWLYKKTALRQFQLKAMVEGFNVVEVNPWGTSKQCHRCGSTVEEKGRLIDCPKCGLRDYNRDVNAARNIAARASSSTYMAGESPIAVPLGVA